jgi:hypothetical protein
MNKFFFWVGGRKFFGLIIATFLLFFDKMSDQVWLIVYTIFTGSNTYQDYLGIKSGGPNEQNKSS